MAYLINYFKKVFVWFICECLRWSLSLYLIQQWDLVFFLDNQMFQYFITVVPTKLHTYKISAETHQFSVTERVSRRENHAEKNLTAIILNRSSNVKIET